MLKGQTFEEIISDNLSDKDIRKIVERLFGGINQP